MVQKSSSWCFVCYTPLSDIFTTRFKFLNNFAVHAGLFQLESTRCGVVISIGCWNDLLGQNCSVWNQHIGIPHEVDRRFQSVQPMQD